MPRFSNAEKQEWAFFIDPKTRRRKYNNLCRKCVCGCKQSFRVIIIRCPKFKAKRQKYYQAKKQITEANHLNKGN